MTISFARGVPPPEALPVEELADCAREAVLRDGPTVLNYGPIGGYGPLREWVAERHDVEPQRVLLTNGSLQGISLLARELLRDSSRRVLVEAPTYDRPLKILGSLRAEVIAIRQDDDGLDVDALERELAQGGPAAFLYTIPTFQNPSGRTLSRERRQRLVDLAREHRLLVLEDDPYGLVRFDGSPPQTLFELAGGDGVLYMSSFSKIVSPGVRVAYLILPPELVRPIEESATQTYLTPSLLSQATVFEFLRRGNLEPNLERVRSLLCERRDAMLAALAATFPESARWSWPEGGYFLWLDLPEGVDAGDLLARAVEEGVSFVKGSDFYPEGRGGASAARLAYSFATPAEIAEGVGRLGRLLRLAPPLAVPV